MPDVVDHDLERGGVDLVDDPVVPHAKARQTLGPAILMASRGRGSSASEATRARTLGATFRGRRRRSFSTEGLERTL